MDIISTAHTALNEKPTHVLALLCNAAPTTLQIAEKIVDKDRIINVDWF